MQEEIMFWLKLFSWYFSFGLIQKSGTKVPDGKTAGNPYLAGGDIERIIG
jgi:hypothetical protein